ncbi:DUF2059 domain-containing protein [Polaromonas jejuensis]|uniref:DUF2059 domain-containing protein n=1 Tax=Polaromonas jejuensis TaxID=457502 RepID=A0ABW0QAE9_9BURK|nr:DUF2059 domain-containing protein [Polaromonas jejuensis]
MKKLITTMAITALAGLASSTALHAQTPDAKTEWATKVVALQQGPELDRLVAQLAGSTTQDLIANWGPKLEANVPKAKQQKASEELNVELKKYTQDTNQLIGKQVKKVSTDVLVPAYAERFTLEELKQIAAFFESPAIKKYQTTAPELGNVFIQKLIDASRADVQARAKQFDDAALKIVGSAPAAPAAGKPAKK